MDSYEWNKIAGAVLFALLLSVGLTILSDVLFHTEAPETPGYIVALATEEGSEGAAEAEPLAVQLAAADPQAGEGAAKKCIACHTFEAGGANKVGPNLWGVVERPIASHEGFEYDAAMEAYAETAKTWSFDNLNAFLHDPKGVVPGTKMAFPGLKDDKERANVLVYLRSLSDNPVALPEPTPAGEQSASVEPATATDAGTAEPAAEAAPAAEAPAAEAPAAEAPAEAPAPAETAEAPAEQPAATPEAPAAEAPAPAATAEATAAAPAEAPAPAEQQVAQTEPAPAPAPAAEAAAAGAGDAAAGEKFAARCKACHSLEKGGPNMVGPHIFGVVGRPIASVADFSYSDAMKEFSAGGTKVWDEATLDTYLGDPRKTVPGNKMAFPGVKKETDRANLIAYLKTLAE